MRLQVPGLTLRSTVLVGFPGETNEDFEELLRLMGDIRFEHLGGFVWSPEEGTSALNLNAPQVSEDLARERLGILTSLQEEISLEINEEKIGQTLRVMIDSVAEESEFHFYGRTQGDALDTDNIVRITEGSARVGGIYPVRIVDAGAHELDGVVGE
jgi:ribosomal protein S12 methylthiotransferase